jgi:signal transduction histidine kinase
VRRQAFFFIVAIVLPCVVLALLTWRMVRQERELGEQRVVDEQRRLVSEGRQWLLARVDRIRRAAIAPEAVLPAEVALVAQVDGATLILPWESSRPDSDLQQAPFRDLVAAGERLEFGGARLDEAIAAYRRASRASRLPAQQAFAELLAARALSKAGRAPEAAALAKGALALPANVVDDQAIPLAVYAARLIVESGGRSEPGLGRALAALSDAPTIGPAAIYMARDVALKLGDRELATRLDRRIRDIEQALALRDRFSTLGVLAGDAATPVWHTFGTDPPWLIGVFDAGERPLLTAVRQDAVLAVPPDGLEFVSPPAGESLGPVFPTLRVALSPDRAAALASAHRTQRPLYLATLLVVVSVALSGAYLFWRDVQRDIHVAEMRSQFVSSVSHELKTPLTAIRMFAETLLGRRMDPSIQHEYLETIVNESERLTRLLDNVLDFSKIESGNKAYHAVPQPLGEVVRGAAKAMHYAFTQQGFDLRIAVDDRIPLVAVDADAIQQAVLNLLSNAMKYSGDARVVEISLSRDGDDAVIAVVDHGVGIAAGEHQRIFEKFYRVHNDSTARVAGTGLGLTLVDHVARGHGGRVCVESSPGEGSRFAIRLPLLPSTTSSAAAGVPA